MGSITNTRHSGGRKLVTHLMGGAATGIAAQAEIETTETSGTSTSGGTVPPSYSSDPLALNRVVPRLEAIRVVGVSEATWDRIERRGEGPRRTLLSERRVGYRVRDLLAWLDARASDAGPIAA